MPINATQEQTPKKNKNVINNACLLHFRPIPSGGREQRESESEWAGNNRHAVK
jgi:hypothetical protein